MCSVGPLTVIPCRYAGSYETYQKIKSIILALSLLARFVFPRLAYRACMHRQIYLGIYKFYSPFERYSTETVSTEARARCLCGKITYLPASVFAFASSRANSA